MTPERRAQMLAFGELHSRFVKAKADGAPFRPEDWPEGSDYNQHYVDLEADDDLFHVEARKILGIAE